MATRISGVIQFFSNDNLTKNITPRNNARPPTHANNFTPMNCSQLMLGAGAGARAGWGISASGGGAISWKAGSGSSAGSITGLIGSDGNGGGATYTGGLGATGPGGGGAGGLVASSVAANSAAADFAGAAPGETGRSFFRINNSVSRCSRRRESAR